MQQASHLDQGCDRVGEVLQDLVGVYHVEGLILELQRLHVGGLELNIARAAFFQHVDGLDDDRRFPIYSDCRSGRDPRSQVDGDRAGSASNIQQAHAGLQVRQQVAS